MRKFNVFCDADGRYKAVKQGWCWPAFFFGPMWALFGGLWLTAFFVFIIDLPFSIAGNKANNFYDPYYFKYDETAELILLVIFSIPLAIRIVLGIFGNKWRAKKLRKLGLSLVACVKADGKNHAISLCKNGERSQLSTPDVVEQERWPQEPMRQQNKRSISISEAEKYSTDHGENQSHVMDSFLLIFAVIIGIAACSTVVGFLPVGILLFGLAASLKGGNPNYLKTATRIVSGFGCAILVVSVGVGAVHLAIYLSWITSQSEYTFSRAGEASSIAFCVAGLSLATICSLRYLWLNPLLRQFDAIRTRLFAIKIPDVPKRQKAQKIVSRDALHAYSVADEIAKWKALHDQGVIDDEEYQLARRRLLNPD